ncbi:MAG TPA: hypothetical protein VFT19_03825 [Solirubrobacterales bacterium]|nr:hypothetical protein [Solirubrobacterales bacterium]
MGALAQEDRPRLEHEQYSLKEAQVTWGGTLGVLSAAGMAFGPQTAALPFAVGSICVAVLKRKEIAVERALNDPPRSDWETATRAHRRRYVSGALGDDRLAIATDQAAIATLRATAYLEASVRADERAQGARLAGRNDFVAQQLERASNLFELAMSWSGEMAVSLNALALSWAAYAADSGLDDRPLPATIAEVALPSAGHEAFSRTRLVTADLKLEIGRPEDVRLVVDRPGRNTVGDVAIESAVSTRELSRSAGEVAMGRRALPRRTAAEPELLSPASTRLLLEADDRAEARRHLVQAAEDGSSDAMFNLGALAREGGDRAEARAWFDRAATATAPVSPPQYRLEVKRADDSEQRSLSLPKQIESSRVAGKLSPRLDANRVSEYWLALSENGRKVFGAASTIERERGPGYTFDDIGEVLDLPYESVKSMHRSTGRTARRWRLNTGTEEPIRLEPEDYGWDDSREGNRTTYRLPVGVADVVHELRQGSR